MIKRTRYQMDRRLGLNIMDRIKNPVTKRCRPRGSKPTSRIISPSLYGKVLRAEQIATQVLCFLKKYQFRAHVSDAKRKDDPSTALVQSAGMRLISVVYRANWAATPYAANQLIGHGHVTVNGKKITTAQQILNIGDVVKIKNYENDHVQRACKNGERAIPSFLKVDKNTATIVGLPSTVDPWVSKINFAAILVR